MRVVLLCVIFTVVGLFLGYLLCAWSYKEDLQAVKDALREITDRYEDDVVKAFKRGQITALRQRKLDVLIEGLDDLFSDEKENFDD